MGVDCILVHVPKLLERSKYVGWFSRINFLSMGIFSIAEELTHQGLAARILHVGVEKQRDPGFLLADYVRAQAAPVVAFALHWHQQTFDTLDAARQLKAALPDVRIVLGGLTASHFAHDIVDAFPFVDGVIRGEAERPLAQYVRAVLDQTPLSAVENLTWRDRGMIRQQPITFTTGPDDLNAWRFEAWDLLEHNTDYLRQNWVNSWEPEFIERSLPREPTLFGAALGRGCMGTCTWCAGSFAPMKAATGRKKTAWRRADRIAETIDRVRSRGVKRIYTCFDPLPNRMQEVLDLFDTLGGFPDKVLLDFETFGLPAPEMVESYARNLAPGSRLIISPETSDEGLRNRHRAFPFTNAQLEATLEHMHRLGVMTELYFIIGLPGDTVATVEATARWQQDLQARWPNICSTFTWPLEMEPGSPWFLHPERYGLTLRHRTIQDFYEAHRRPEFSLGYDLETLTEAEILDLHDLHFQMVPVGSRRELRDYWRLNPREYAAVRVHA